MITTIKLRGNFYEIIGYFTHCVLLFRAGQEKMIFDASEVSPYDMHKLKDISTALGHGWLADGSTFIVIGK